jgi:hypothetical protein
MIDRPTEEIVFKRDALRRRLMRRWGRSAQLNQDDRALLDNAPRFVAPLSLPSTWARISAIMLLEEMDKDPTYAG